MKCDTIGYMASMCKNESRTETPIPASNIMHTSQNSEYNNKHNLSSSSENSVSKIFSINSNRIDEENTMYISINIFGKMIKFQVDTGSPVSAIPGESFDKEFS